MSKIYQFITMGLNLLCGFGAAIWLVVIGQWPLVVAGVVLMFLIPYVYSFLMLPVTIPIGNIVRRDDDSSQQSSFLIGIMVSFGALILAAMTIGLMIGANQFFSSSSRLPGILWCYGVIVGTMSDHFVKSDPERGIGLAMVCQLVCIICGVVLLATS